MHIAHRADVVEPIASPSGEVVFELVGAAPASGAAKHHSLAFVVIPPGKSSARHYHLVAEETFFVLQGTARMVIDDRDFPLMRGHACLIQPGEKHQIWNPGDKELQFIAVCAPPWVPTDSVFE